MASGSTAASASLDAAEARAAVASPRPPLPLRLGAACISAINDRILDKQNEMRRQQISDVPLDFFMCVLKIICAEQSQVVMTPLTEKRSQKIVMIEYRLASPTGVKKNMLSISVRRKIPLSLSIISSKIPVPLYLPYHQATVSCCPKQQTNTSSTWKNNNNTGHTKNIKITVL